MDLSASASAAVALKQTQSQNAAAVSTIKHSAEIDSQLVEAITGAAISSPTYNAQGLVVQPAGNILTGSA